MTPLEVAQLDLLELKKALRISYVMHHYGHAPVLRDGGGKLHYYSPFREDNNPSFDVFSQTIKGRKSPEERFGDFAEGSNGDVIDLIERFEGANRFEALETARNLLLSQVSEEWDEPEVIAQAPVPLDMDDVADLYLRRRPAHITYDFLKLTRPGLPDSVPGVYTHPEKDVLMFFNRDETEEFCGVHFRTADRKWRLKGSRSSLIRMEPPSQKPVFLTEGETDTWAAWGQLGDAFEVLGVPGVGNLPEKLLGDQITDRIVYVAFDPDEAGQAAVSRWGAYLRDRGCEVRLVLLPEGKDIASLHKPQILELPNKYRTAKQAPDDFGRDGDRFVSIVGKNGDVVERSNWSFAPHSVLIGEDNLRGYEGVLRPSGTTVVLPASVLQTVSRLKAWGMPHGASWYGNDTDAQKLQGLLEHEAAFLPEVPVSQRAGLHYGSFVWPSGCVGEQHVVYTPPVSSIGIDKLLHVTETEYNPVRVFTALFRLQNPAATGPILSWLAAAFLRPKFRQFPILNISGISGSGKSALTQEMLRVFAGSEILTTLASTTPLAVESTIASSNAFPVWFDEYRPGMRGSAKQRLDSILRDAYRGQDSRKGGQSDKLSEITSIPTDTPIIVSGEDNFSEVSHTDRMIQVNLLASEQGPLAPVESYETGALTRPYLDFLTSPGLDVFSVPPVYSDPVLRPTGIPGLRGRQEDSIQVIKYGWSLLREFLRSYDPSFDMPPLDLSRVVQTSVESGKQNPIEDAVKACLENDTKKPAAWVKDGYLNINSQNLLDESRHLEGIILPASSAKGITMTLKGMYPGAESKTVYSPNSIWNDGKQMRVISIPLDDVSWALQEDIHAVHEIRT